MSVWLVTLRRDTLHTLLLIPLSDRVSCGLQCFLQVFVLLQLFACKHLDAYTCLT